MNFHKKLALCVICHLRGGKNGKNIGLTLSIVVKNVGGIKTQRIQTIKLISPHQLFQGNLLFTIDDSIYQVEAFLFFRQYNSHK